MRRLAIYFAVVGLFALAACEPIWEPTKTNGNGSGEPPCWECPPPPASIPTDTVRAGALRVSGVPDSGFTFSPTALTIKVGSTVTWSNGSPYPHSATSDTGVWDSRLLAVGNGSYSFTFTTPGTYPYHCSYHGEQGTIVVVTP